MCVQKTCTYPFVSYFQLLFPVVIIIVLDYSYVFYGSSDQIRPGLFCAGIYLRSRWLLKSIMLRSGMFAMAWPAWC